MIDLSADWMCLVGLLCVIAALAMSYEYGRNSGFWAGYVRCQEDDERTRERFRSERGLGGFDIPTLPSASDV